MAVYIVTQFKTAAGFDDLGRADFPAGKQIGLIVRLGSRKIQSALKVHT